MKIYQVPITTSIECKNPQTLFCLVKRDSVCNFALSSITFNITKCLIEFDSNKVKTWLPLDLGCS